MCNYIFKYIPRHDVLFSLMTFDELFSYDCNDGFVFFVFKGKMWR